MCERVRPSLLQKGGGRAAPIRKIMGEAKRIKFGASYSAAEREGASFESCLKNKLNFLGLSFSGRHG